MAGFILIFSMHDLRPGIVQALCGFQRQVWEAWFEKILVAKSSWCCRVSRAPWLLFSFRWRRCGLRGGLWQCLDFVQHCDVHAIVSREGALRWSSRQAPTPFHSSSCFIFGACSVFFVAERYFTALFVLAVVGSMSAVGVVHVREYAEVLAWPWPGAPGRLRLPVSVVPLGPVAWPCPN